MSVDTLVEEAGISRSALFKKIKTLIGISPMELIKNIRLKKAAELIETYLLRTEELGEAGKIWHR